LLQVNRSRLLKTISESSSIGSTKNGGLSRLALTKEDQVMRDKLVEWLKDAGLQVRIDDFGNVYGRREGKLKDAEPVVIGSHLDTQPSGGRYDGVIGVLSALEVIRCLNDRNTSTDYPIEIVNFTGQEGARFRPPMLGSAGIAGAFTKEYIYSRKDAAGIAFKDALQQIGYMGDEQNRLKQAKNYIELHIEQGSILDRENISIGIVEGIQGMSWLRVKVIGEANHAGPTKMEDRNDALIPVAKMILKVRELTDEIEELTTTIGKMDVKPNISNIIPGEVEFSIDVRHSNNTIRFHAIESLKEQLSAIAFIHDVQMTISTTWSSDAIEFSNDIREHINEAAKKFGYSRRSLYSGPGHDATYMSQIANTGMIFVKSVNGMSHNEQEYTPDEDIVKGANTLLDVALNLANEGEINQKEDQEALNTREIFLTSCKKQNERFIP